MYHEKVYIFLEINYLGHYMLVQSGLFLNVVNCDNIFWSCYEYSKAHFNYAFGKPRVYVCRGCVFFLLNIKLKEDIYFKLLAVKGANVEDVMALSHYRSPVAQQFIVQLTYIQ